MRTRKQVVFCFLAIETALYLSFMTLDLFSAHVDTRYLKYGSILLCFLYALYLARLGGDCLAALGLALTLGADTFLLLLDRWYLAGVALFGAVQLVYLFRLRPVTARGLLPERGLLFLLLLVILRFLGQLSVLNAAAVLYISVFFFNLLQSFFWKSREGRRFTAGLLLYFLCDLCVAVCNSPALFPPKLYAFSQIGMWLFYLPGQVLIALSASTSPKRSDSS